MRHAWYQQLSGLALEASKAALADSVPALSVGGHSIATFAGGCFWGIELAFQRVPGVVATGTGYTQGHVAEPSYQEVCSGTTGHTEAIQVHFKPNEVSYEDLLKVFWERIDPLMENGQGGDRGTQYRTGIYTHTDAQHRAALQSREIEQRKYSRPIMTEIKPAKVFWPAEVSHQGYLWKGGRFGSAQSAAKGCTDPIRCYG
ncbi:hypothetical protein NSK_001318 [Nannochloropsis salina CCMP1776]|uniref:peptide-methionine (S)-S-oxide reductase n=1 Tax=Nannochloropsis salina CCMP1776 TaxID=1027361 RepID=A0A4D9D7I8_9STRA|nr:hypothetical protein NSK_001318 [Nannochloropsis salina CCMP1776]|eukprot:TFJ86984.1 hypothetical protein NSK_001318 [Nannochloropsis salina CCMP1776]